MRIVLDACVPERLARYIPGHEVTTVRAALGTTDFDDGALLEAIAPLCDAFVTVDKSLRYQQNLRARPYRIMLLRAHSNAIEHLVPLLPRLEVVLTEMQAGELRVLGL
jgi:predicted nuclease of predicted toxin-antitoxin system